MKVQVPFELRPLFFFVQYGYSLMSGGANNSRLTSMTYPQGNRILIP